MGFSDSKAGSHLKFKSDEFFSPETEQYRVYHAEVNEKLFELDENVGNLLERNSRDFLSAYQVSDIDKLVGSYGKNIKRATVFAQEG